MVNDFRRRLSVDGPMQFVLYRGKEAPGGLSRHIVIKGGGKDKFVQGDVESICKADPQVYFAASVLWQIVASWVNDLREY